MSSLAAKSRNSETKKVTRSIRHWKMSYSAKMSLFKTTKTLSANGTSRAKITCAKQKSASEAPNYSQNSKTCRNLTLVKTTSWSTSGQASLRKHSLSSFLPSFRDEVKKKLRSTVVMGGGYMDSAAGDSRTLSLHSQDVQYPGPSFRESSIGGAFGGGSVIGGKSKNTLKISENNQNAIKPQKQKVTVERSGLKS